MSRVARADASAAHALPSSMTLSITRPFARVSTVASMLWQTQSCCVHADATGQLRSSCDFANARLRFAYVEGCRHEWRRDKGIMSSSTVRHAT